MTEHPDRVIEALSSEWGRVEVEALPRRDLPVEPERRSPSLIARIIAMLAGWRSQEAQNEPYPNDDQPEAKAQNGPQHPSRLKAQNEPLTAARRRVGVYAATRQARIFARRR